MLNYVNNIFTKTIKRCIILAYNLKTIIKVAKDMQVNYKDIGSKIRYERKKQSITQEKLAELCNISIPHMSNIENANTKVSLPVLVDIANALNCTVDYLLCNSLKNNVIISDSVVNDILSGCSNMQRAIIMENMISLKNSLANYGE